MGGANRSMLQLMIELRQYGHQITVLTPKYENPININLIDELESEGFEHIEAHYYWFKFGSGQKLKSVIKQSLNLLNILYIIYKIKGLKFDIVHSNSSVCDIGAYISLLKGIPHVWHLREFGDIDFNLQSAFGKKYERFIYRHAEKFIAISQRIQRHFADRIPHNKIELIYNGIKFQKGHRVCAPTTINNIVHFCLVGMLSDAKNPFQALEASIILLKRGITNFHITLMGGCDVIYEENLKSYIRQNNLSKYVTLTGEVTDVLDRLSAMDVGLMLSHNEAFGRVTIEYMLSGLAVIASDTGANPEIIENGKSGLLYDKNSSASLANAMETLIKDTELRGKIALGGREKASYFNSERNSQLINNLYNDIMYNSRNI
ncbi:glycosyltransferase family 4 protein [uncultured Duncaniella sp.]|uniref:glycosyltransferase family 4 protein n=1 Tax=uncultured Duncaniella sp. TaxID=2768039 RepID=UPI0025A9B66F|nr:glycosyltransferase family 4 protein [uncultured Duncaniella sp.]